MEQLETESELETENLDDDAYDGFEWDYKKLKRYRDLNADMIQKLTTAIDANKVPSPMIEIQR